MPEAPSTDPVASVASLTLTLPVSFRRCRREDLRALEWFGLFTPQRAAIRETFARQQRGEAIILIADLNGAPIAQVGIDLRVASGADRGFLSGLRVFPWFRGLGLSRRVIEAAEQTLRERSLAHAEVGVEKENGPAMRFFNELGYHVVAPRHEEYAYKSPGGLLRRVKVDQWLLCKSLRAEPPVATGAAPAARERPSPPPTSDAS